MAVFGLVGKIIGAVVLLLILLGVGAGFAYATDYGLEATVTEKDCVADPEPTVRVKTRVGGIGHTVEVPSEQCATIQPGNFVVYHLRSSRTIIYEAEGGPCIYDTETGPGCGASLFGPG